MAPLLHRAAIKKLSDQLQHCMCRSLIEIGSKTAEKNSAQTNRETDKQTDTTEIMVTWP